MLLLHTLNILASLGARGRTIGATFLIPEFGVSANRNQIIVAPTDAKLTNDLVFRHTASRGSLDTFDGLDLVQNSSSSRSWLAPVRPNTEQDAS